ncbi:hypothetical protein HYFRA_00012281 [Hymenoscyphus fraxineus]|uniref:Uncharacterized protein n=1 Tax=Hymenoscyphus fraxineus TaxID=746836 RepID=A0A9N9PWL8_9HELO|nr:hypothetical protein HYFRA_00012281 [Hymenoscyphus fraxineus]
MEGNRPFSDEEKRNVLAEALKQSPIPNDRLLAILNELPLQRSIVADALKASTIPIERLLTILNENGINANGPLTPNWWHMVLPEGRSLQSCVDAFHSIQSSQRSSYHSLPPPTISHTGKRKSGPDSVDHFMTDPAPKRRQSGPDTIMSTTRDILPKPTSANGSPLHAFSPGPGPGPASAVPKKRGRPSKADVELRQQEAIARGDILQTSAAPGTRTLTPKPPFKPTMRDEPRGLTVLAPMTGPGPPIDQSMGGQFHTERSMLDSAGKKKRPRAPIKPKVSKINEILDNEATQTQAAASRAGQSTFPSMISHTTQGHMQEPQYSPKFLPPGEMLSAPPQESQGGVPQSDQAAQIPQIVQAAQEEARPEVANPTEPPTEAKS